MSKNESGQPESNGGKFFEKNKKTIIAVAVAVTVIIGSVAGYFAVVNNTVAKWEGIIYPGVTVYGVELGGLSKDEAMNKLESDLNTLIGDKELEVKVGEESFSLNYKEISPSYDKEAILEQAIGFGKDKSTFEKYSLIKEESEHDIDVVISYDEKKLQNFVKGIAKDVDIQPEDAIFSFNGGDFAITEEVVGKKLNQKDVNAKILENINTKSDEKITLTFELEVAKPKVTKEALSKINGKMSGYGSDYKPDNADRITNMTIANGAINGTLLMPGDEFSYNEVVGDTTPEKGYKQGAAYVNGKVVQEYGGGVCQVSTALYRAAMRANLRSTERANHSYMVGYSEAGLDATVFTPSPDYKFVNTYDSPIYIEGYLSASQVVFNIYGNVDEMGGKTYELVSEVTETIPYKTEYIDDPTLPAGTEKPAPGSSAITGHRSNAYQITYDANGNKIDSELISSDYYSPLNPQVLRGTKKASN